VDKIQVLLVRDKKTKMLKSLKST